MLPRRGHAHDRECAPHRDHVPCLWSPARGDWRLAPPDNRQRNPGGRVNNIPGINTGLTVASNTISGIKTAVVTGTAVTGTAVGLAAGSVSGAKIVDHTVFGNAVGISLLNGNVDNEIRDNHALDNQLYGIRIQGTGSTGNKVVDNHMYGNLAFDARDDTDRS
jgi:parallel beta-helix repeat protein